MRCLTREEVREWIAQHVPAGTPTDPSGLPQLQVIGHHLVGYQSPTESGRKAFLAKLAYSFFKTYDTVLVYVQNWEIFPSCAHVPLWTRLRQAIGENRCVDEYPAHLFTAAEADDAISILVMAFEFYWDCFVLSDAGDVAFYISHDDYYDFLSRAEAIASEYKAAVEAGM